MTERETKPRDPRPREEIEQIFPTRMWVIARQAAEFGWDISIRTTDDGWVLYLTEDHHCVHITWKPNRRNTTGRYPWDLTRARMGTRCRNGGDVHVKDLPQWLDEHPDECLIGNTRPPLAQLKGIEGCADHILQREAPGFWPRHPAPPGQVAGVVTARGDVWRPTDDGTHFWYGPGYPDGVHWNTLRQWSWLRTATEAELAAAPPREPVEHDGDRFMNAVRDAAR